MIYNDQLENTKDDLINKLCSVCSEKIFALEIDHPLFRHIDFTTIQNQCPFFKCSYCQIITNPHALNSEIPTFGTKEYANSHQTQQTINIGFSKPVTRWYLMLQSIAI